MKKYEMTDNTKDVAGEVVYKIRALKDIPIHGVKAGDLGGYIQCERNLCHHNSAWVGNEAVVYGRARVVGDAYVYDRAKVCGEHTLISANAIVFGDARIYRGAKVSGRAKVYGSAVIFEGAFVSNDAQVYDMAEVYGKASIYGFAQVYDRAIIGDYAKVYDTAKVYGDAKVHAFAEVYGCAEVFGKLGVMVSGFAEIMGDAIISSNNDYIVFKNFWDAESYFTWTRSNNKYRYHSFYGTCEEFITYGYNDCTKVGIECERIVKYVNSI